MELELKNVKIHADMSQETSCFSATLYVDGQKAGVVSNRGTGGCNDYHWDDFSFGRKVTEWANAQPTKFDFEKLDQLVDDLLTTFQIERQMKGWMRRNTPFRLKGDKPGAWRMLTVANAGDEVRQKYGETLEIVLTPETLPQAAKAEMNAQEQARARV